KQEVDIIRFHICTWDIENESSFVEIGIEFKFQNQIKEIDFNFVAPFINKGYSINCLCSNLIKDSNNSKFIFNDNIKTSSAIKGDKRNGAILDFETRGVLNILPIQQIVIEEEQIVSFKIQNPKTENDSPCYVRFLIKSKRKTLSTENRGIAKTSFIYDVKLNEKRNLPNKVYELTKDKYHLCNVDTCFCFHVVPNSFAITFTDSNRLKNIRELEVLAFKEYLPGLKSMKENEYVIVFNKDEKREAYSFFTVFTRETIGTKQILFAVSANILCSLLFAISSWRKGLIAETSFLCQIPFEYWLSFFILLIVFLTLFSPLYRIKNFFKRNL
ncbi:hypothetical protein LJC67_06970, partial [Bacteroidales bacterium OttesenSCG-928-A14]|nr:hypothetical protein [Bacteroidales bacterium OttesenSCG-928-A14]